MDLREGSGEAGNDGVRKALVSLVNANAGVFRTGFAAWLEDNLHVWTAFEREATKVMRRGRTHYSARTIIEVLRHESALADHGIEYKLNNNTAPDLARLWCLARPADASLFELRVMHDSTRTPIA